MRIIPLILMLLALSPRSCAAAAVFTLGDGEVIEGTARIDRGRLLVKVTSGEEREVKIETLRHAVFEQAAATPAARPAQRAGKPAEKPTPAKRLEGLRGEYYDVEFRERKLVRIDPKIDFEFPEKEPTDPAVPNDFAARWTGLLHAADLGKHLFSVELHSHDEKVRVWIDDQLIIDRWGDKSAGYTGAVDLRPDQKYSIKVEYVDERSWGRVRLYWSSPRQGRQVVPAARLLPPEGTVPPAVSVVEPLESSNFISPAEMTLEAQAIDPDGSVKRVEFIVDGATVGSAEAEPWRFKWKNPSAGIHKLQAKAMDDAGISALSPPVVFAVAASSSKVAAPWAEIPLGRSYVMAEAQASGGRFTLSSAGGDVWGDRDAMQFVLQRLGGDGSLVARLVSFDAPKSPDAPGAAAGLLLREHLNPGGARQAMVGFSPEIGAMFLRREHAWDERKLTEEELERITLPHWFRISRNGKNLSAFHSADGRKWSSLGTRRIEIGTDVYLGLAMGNPSIVPATAVFDRVSFTSGAISPEGAVRGALLVSGSIVAGNLQSVDETSLKLSGRFGTVAIPVAQVARLVFRPISPESAEQIQPGRTGAILGNGDFFDGAIESLRHGQVEIQSVLFGMRRYNIGGDEVTAILLRDPRPGAWRFEVRGADGSVIRCSGLAMDRDRVVLTEAGDAQFSLRLGDLAEIRSIE